MWRPSGRYGYSRRSGHRASSRIPSSSSEAWRSRRGKLKFFVHLKAGLHKKLLAAAGGSSREFQSHALGQRREWPQKSAHLGSAGSACTLRPKDDFADALSIASQAREPVRGLAVRGTLTVAYHEMGLLRGATRMRSTSSTPSIRAMARAISCCIPRVRHRAGASTVRRPIREPTHG